ncbi:hypothetical protein L2E82_21470 [Cichorium intybus]|uniref:Uncharacterized protein n=1 Tax=Cichorium intybus TaxID=13427 RepID=A0ACB9DVX4_CICIN|nr:hypothetical protein L2E82_21470 [Cichorium intybus]
MTTSNCTDHIWELAIALAAHEADAPATDEAEDDESEDEVRDAEEGESEEGEDLEAAMKSETEDKYQQYVNTLTERIQTCDGILQQVIEKQRLIEFAAVNSTILMN